MNQAIFSMLIGKKIRILRKMLKLNQKDFCTLLAIEQSQLSKIERGMQTVTVPVICCLAKRFNIDLLWFFDEIRMELNQETDVSGFHGLTIPNIAGSPPRRKVN